MKSVLLIAGTVLVVGVLLTLTIFTSSTNPAIEGDAEFTPQLYESLTEPKALPRSVLGHGESNPSFRVVYQSDVKFGVTHGGEVNVTSGPFHVNTGNSTIAEGNYQCFDGVACTKYVFTNSSSLIIKVT